METNVLDGAQLNERFITAAGEIVTLVRYRDDNGEFRYVMRSMDGHELRNHNAAGLMPLNYDPGSYIVRKYVEPKRVYAEVPVAGVSWKPPARG